LVEIQISDDGLGIPAEQISRIFDRFFQVDRSSTRNYEGTGIGLALVKELVELHRGKITVNSIDGEGSVFTLVLPVGDVKQEIKTGDIGISGDIGASLTNSETEFYENKYITSKTGKPAIDEREIVLGVEDNIEIRQYIREQLEEFYNVLEAENGSEGMEVALKIVPDLIVSDLMMPKVNGFQFCKAIRNNEQTSHIPIVILTAKAGFDSKIAGFENGVDDFIVKPFSARELKVRVRNLINQRKLLRTRFKSATVIRPSEVTAVSIDQLFLGKIIKLIEANFENQNFTPELLAGSVNMSVSQLNRKLNALIEQPAGQLMRSLRLQRAADLLKLKAGTISEICYLLDFNDPAYFSRAFKKQFGCSPSEFAKN
jgi:CheY-like chemotaxis protein